MNGDAVAMMATWQGTSDPVPSTSGGVGDDYKLIYPRDKIIYKVSERGKSLAGRPSESVGARYLVHAAPRDSFTFSEHTM